MTPNPHIMGKEQENDDDDLLQNILTSSIKITVTTSKILKIILLSQRTNPELINLMSLWLYVHTYVKREIIQLIKFRNIVAKSCSLAYVAYLHVRDMFYNIH